MSVRSNGGDPVGIARHGQRRFRWHLPRRAAEVRPDATPGDLLRALQLEIYRSRRSGRRLALIGLSPPNGSAGEIGQTIRAIDHARIVDGRLYLLLPETDRRAAYALIARIEALFEAPVAGGFEVAVFPEDALTPEALIERVSGRAPREADRAPLASGTTASRGA